MNIAKHYANEEIGGVAGEKKIITIGKDRVGNGESLYWNYESFLKKIDSDFYSVVGAAGELFSFRKSLYEPLPHFVVLDDFVTSMKIAQKGFRIVYEPLAYAMETPSASIKDEQKRKVRIAAGGFQALTMLTDALFFWKHFKLSFLYVSHRVLRWTLTPLCLITAFISNVFLLFSPIVFYKITFSLQIIFYLLAIISKYRDNNKLLKLPHYFVFTNTCIVLGFIKHITKGQSSAWEKAKRVDASPTKSTFI